MAQSGHLLGLSLQMASREMSVAAFCQFGRDLPAAGLGLGAAGVKMAGLRRVHRARHIALQADPLAFDFRVGDRHGGAQSGHSLERPVQTKQNHIVISIGIKSS